MTWHDVISQWLIMREYYATAYRNPPCLIYIIDQKDLSYPSSSICEKEKDSSVFVFISLKLLVVQPQNTVLIIFFVFLFEL